MIVGGHGGNIRAASEIYGFKPEEFIDFSANINPLGLPDKIRDIIISSISGLLNYPDIEYLKLKHSLSEQYNIPIFNIVTGNGSAELIDLFVRVANKKNALIIEPNFFEYERSLRNNGIIPNFIIGEKSKNFKVSVKDIISKVEMNSIVFISSPNNPVGYVYTEDELILLIKQLNKKKSCLFVDEAFLDFIIDGEISSASKLIEENSNLIVLKSLTKILAIPGLRLGMLFAPQEISSNMKLIQTPWSINIFAEKVGEDISLFNDFIKDSANYIFQERKRFGDELKTIIEIEIMEGYVNYFLCRLNSKYPYQYLERFLGENKILIRSCANYPGLDKQYFRIAVKRKNENDLLIDKLKQFFAGSEFA